jgi:tRNA wybutosine-synthesizing protein 3
MTASLDDAKHMLTAASAAGFRESGAMTFPTIQDQAKTPIVAVRSNGLALDSIVGYIDDHGTPVCIVPEEHLCLLNNIATERFKVNTERIGRFRQALLTVYTREKSKHAGNINGHEDSSIRRERKRAEGLLKQELLRAEKATINNDEGADIEK